MIKIQPLSLRGIRHGTLKERYSRLEWWSPVPLSPDLALLLCGLLFRARDKGGTRQITARSPLRAQVIFVLYLWDFLRSVNPDTLAGWMKSGLVTSECENRLEYWKQWRATVRLLRMGWPQWWPMYVARAKALVGFKVQFELGEEVGRHREPLVGGKP